MDFEQLMTSVIGDDPLSGGERYLSPREAAGLFRLTLRTWQRLCERGEGLPFVRLSERRIAYSTRALREWAEHRTVNGKRGQV
jgi:hypothetical protein